MAFRKKVARKQLIEFFASFHAYTVVMETGAGADYMVRKQATSGREVKPIPPRFVGPFLKNDENDFVDAEAICEAATRPAMLFVAGVVAEIRLSRGGVILRATVRAAPLCSSRQWRKSYRGRSYAR
jgi:hypothetical protein